MSGISSSHSYEEEDNERFLLPNVGDTEDVERYAPGGFHPVHLGDTYDEGRYRIVHKLGAGGFATVWLARDERERTWVALKIVRAEHFTLAGNKNVLICQDASDLFHGPAFAAEFRRFIIAGPNGRHLCLVLPVLGPSASQLSSNFDSRLKPWLSRRAGYQVTKAVAAMHARGLCHGDVTTANILFTLSSFGHLEEADIYHLFGSPETGALETESGEPTGPEAPQYIVKTLDFLSSTSNIIAHDVKLVDFDQCFAISSPPEKMIGTPAEFLAPEVAVGLPASPASDVWALGCCIFRLRSGEGPFSNYEVTCPGELIRIVFQTLGELPQEWQDTLWDDDGQPTKDPNKGKPFDPWEGKRSLRDLVYRIWDQPDGDVIQTGRTWPDRPMWGDDHKPFPPCFSNIAWKPRAVKVDNVYLNGYNDMTEGLLEPMPKIAELEATLLYDLLSKIFVYDPKRRPTANEILNHPWFHMDGQFQ
ncbi:kinase-like protein [Ustulina deusta]|nr:kinase-like protein [Ustulina deusta]